MELKRKRMETWNKSSMPKTTRMPTHHDKLLIHVPIMELHPWYHWTQNFWVEGPCSFFNPGVLTKANQIQTYIVFKPKHSSSRRTWTLTEVSEDEDEDANFRRDRWFDSWLWCLPQLMYVSIGQNPGDGWALVHECSSMFYQNKLFWHTPCDNEWNHDFQIKSQWLNLKSK